MLTILTKINGKNFSKWRHILNPFYRKKIPKIILKYLKVSFQIFFKPKLTQTTKTPERVYKIS